VQIELLAADLQDKRALSDDQAMPQFSARLVTQTASHAVHEAL
jgi:hypothetical protein